MTTLAKTLTDEQIISGNPGYPCPGCGRPYWRDAIYEVGVDVCLFCDYESGDDEKRSESE